MEQNEWTDILNALKSINHSMDERFEKDAGLYISMEDTDELKKKIFDGQYRQIIDKFKYGQFSPEALANLLIKNAWLIQNTENKKFEALREIFDACDFSYFSGVMQDGVFENKIEMPTDFRILLLTVFLERADSLTCTQMLQQNIQFLNNVKLRAICVLQALKEQPILERYENFCTYVHHWENLLTEEKTLSKLFAPDKFTDEVRNKIFDNEFRKNSAACNFWINRLGADNAEYMFNLFKNYCRANSGSPANITPWLLHMFNLARKNPEKNIPLFAEYFADACQSMDANRKITLAQNGINKTTDTETAIFQTALQNRGIDIGARGELADLEQIINTLEGHWYQRSLNFLVLSFKKKYGRNYKEKLSEIRAEVSDDRFKEFCFRLIEKTDNNPEINMKYLLYFIEKVLPVATLKTDPWVQKFLHYVENRVVLTSPNYRRLNGFDKIRNFVREKDFNLYSSLITT